MNTSHLPRNSRAKGLFPSLVLGLSLLVASCGGDRPNYQGGDIDAFQAELKEGVERGDITLEEAHVELAIAKKQSKRSERKKRNSGTKLGAFGDKLKQQVKDGELTEAEAAAKFQEFQSRFSKNKDKANAKKPKQPADSDKKEVKGDKEAK